MDLVSRLDDGTCGVRWRPPEEAALGQRTDDFATWRGGALAWSARWLPSRFALGPGEDAALRADLEVSARHAFVLHWSQQQDRSRPPRTATAGWSPLVEADAVELPGGRAAAVIRRHAYMAGDETVVGHLIVPVAAGHVDLQVIAKATTIGAREALLAAKLPPGAPPPDQAEIDRSDHDPLVPTHPLALVRGGLGRLLLDVEVTAPAPPPVPGEVVLTALGCALIPPPRYRPVAEAVNPAVAELERVGLNDWRRTLDVWRVPVEVPRDTASRLLEQLAMRSIATWVDAGRQVRHRQLARIDAFAGRPQLELDVIYQEGGLARRSYFRWFVDADGAVFRLGCGADAPATVDELRAQLVAVQSSWRRVA